MTKNKLAANFSHTQSPIHIVLDVLYSKYRHLHRETQYIEQINHPQSFQSPHPTATKSVGKVKVGESINFVPEVETSFVNFFCPSRALL